MRYATCNFAVMPKNNIFYWQNGQWYVLDEACRIKIPSMLAYIYEKRSCPVWPAPVGFCELGEGALFVIKGDHTSLYPYASVVLGDGKAQHLASGKIWDPHTLKVYEVVMP